jgi:AraC-like DNA-binding protein
MEGIDRNWIFNNTKRTATYSNLTPGHYIFKVRGSNSDGLWNQKGTSLDITIKLPFLQSFWSWFFLFICVTAIFFLFYSRSRKIKRAKKEKMERYYKDKNSIYLAKIENCMVQDKPYLDPDLTSPKLAEKLGLSVNHLSFIINHNYKMNFNEFINEFRIEEAKKRLSEPGSRDLNLITIAHEVGFNSKSTFNLFFKKKTGLTPSQFRKKNAINQGSKHN